MMKANLRHIESPSFGLRDSASQCTATTATSVLSSLVALVACLIAGPVAAQGRGAIGQTLEKKVAVSFSGQVAGILNTRCGQCHVQGSKGDFKMSTFSDLMRAKGAVTAGNPSQSALYTMIQEGEMPPKGGMPDEEKDVIKRWIEQGAKFDGTSESANLATMSGPRGNNPSAGGPPPGYTGGQPSGSGGPPAGYASGGPPAGYASGGPPAGSASGGPPSGYSLGGPPAGYRSGGPPAGYADEDGMSMEDAMDATLGMPGYSGGPGRGGPQQGGRSAAVSRGDVMDTYASNLTALMGSMDLSGLFLPDQISSVDSGPVLRNEAEQSFLAGNESMALELMFGHMATEYEDALVSLQSVKFSPLLRRPTWNIRWGVSMYVRGDDTDDPKPIREGATPVRSLASRGGRGGDGNGAARGMQDFSGMMMNNDDMTRGGDFGAQMQSQMMGGMGGPTRQAGRSEPSAPEAPKIPDRTMLSEEAQASLDKTLGLVASVVREEFNKRFQNGDFGPIFSGLAPTVDLDDDRRDTTPPVSGSPSSMSAVLNDALTEAGDPIHPMWQAGVVYLGQGNSDEMLVAAKKANLDLVLHFDVVLKEGRNDTVQNVSRLRLLHVNAPVDSQGRSKTILVTSKSMDSNEAEQFAGAGRMDEREYVDEQLSGVFSIIDRDIKVIDLPPISAETAKRRIATIMSGPEASSLRTLAEIRLYQARGLLSEPEVAAAFEIIGGSDGLLLLFGPTADRVEAARRWAVKSASVTAPK